MLNKNLLEWVQILQCKIKKMQFGIGLWWMMALNCLLGFHVIYFGMNFMSLRQKSQRFTLNFQILFGIEQSSRHSNKSNWIPTASIFNPIFSINIFSGSLTSTRSALNLEHNNQKEIFIFFFHSTTSYNIMWLRISWNWIVDPSNLPNVKYFDSWNDFRAVYNYSITIEILSLIIPKCIFSIVLSQNRYSCTYYSLMYKYNEILQTILGY